MSKQRIHSSIVSVILIHVYTCACHAVHVHFTIQQVRGKKTERKGGSAGGGVCTFVKTETGSVCEA